MASFTLGRCDLRIERPGVLLEDACRQMSRVSTSPLQVLQRHNAEGGKMSQGVKALATRADHWSSVPETHMVEGKERVWQVVHQRPFAPRHDHTHTRL